MGSVGRHKIRVVHQLIEQTVYNHHWQYIGGTCITCISKGDKDFSRGPP